MPVSFSATKVSKTRCRHRRGVTCPDAVVGFDGLGCLITSAPTVGQDAISLVKAIPINGAALSLCQAGSASWRKVRTTRPRLRWGRRDRFGTKACAVSTPLHAEPCAVDRSAHGPQGRVGRS